jgi:nitrile hydratase beta subunit
MDGAHDLGGMDGFGAVVTEPDEPPYHEPWEGRVNGMMFGVAVGRGIRGFRWWIESMGNVEYLSTSYYEHWLHAIEQVLVRTGDLAPGELDAAVAAGLGPGERRDDPDAAAAVPMLLLGVPDHGRAVPPPGRFAVGDRVRVTRSVTREHNRVPRYVRGVEGVIESVSGNEPLEEGIEFGDRQPVYAVCFESSDLWGARAEPGADLVIDLYEKYLEPA